MLQWSWRVQTSFWISVFVFFGQIPRSGVAGSYSSSIFSFLRNPTPFSIVAAPIHILTNRAQVSPFLHILVDTCYFFLMSLWLIATLIGVRWYLIAVLICIYLMINEHIFMYLFAFCMSSLEKCLFRASDHFLIGFLFFLRLSCLEFFWVLAPYQIYDLQLFSPIQ